MLSEEYGLWFYYIKTDTTSTTRIYVPMQTETTLKHLPWFIGITYNGESICHINRLTKDGQELFRFDFHDPKFKSLSRSFTFKEDLSNQPLLKVLKRAIKRYQSAVKNALGVEKSTYSQDLNALLEVICSWKNTD